MSISHVPYSMVANLNCDSTLHSFPSNACYVSKILKVNLQKTKEKARQSFNTSQRLQTFACAHQQSTVSVSHASKDTQTSHIVVF